MTDNGAALGAAGANQGDPHFGDIRIAARALSGNVLAITTPSGPLGGTRAGDIILNNTAALKGTVKFSGGTGRWKKARGTLTFKGTQATNGAYAVTYTGTISY